MNRNQMEVFWDESFLFVFLDEEKKEQILKSWDPSEISFLGDDEDEKELSRKISEGSWAFMVGIGVYGSLNMDELKKWEEISCGHKGSEFVKEDFCGSFKKFVCEPRLLGEDSKEKYYYMKGLFRDNIKYYIEKNKNKNDFLNLDVEFELAFSRMEIDLFDKQEPMVMKEIDLD